MNVNPVKIRGDQVYLEPIDDCHIAGLFSIGQESEDWLYMPRRCFQSERDAEEWVQEAKAFNESGKQVCFAICSALDHAVIGSSRYLNVRSKDRSLEIGYTWMAKKVQQTTANTEAKLLLLSHAFESLNAVRVELKTDSRNKRSQKAIARLGAIKEGVFRKHMIVQDGFIRDTVYFSIIDDEWPSVKAGLQQKLNA